MGYVKPDVRNSIWIIHLSGTGPRHREHLLLSGALAPSWIRRGEIRSKHSHWMTKPRPKTHFKNDFALLCFPFLFINVATRKFRITYLAYIIIRFSFHHNLTPQPGESYFSLFISTSVKYRQVQKSIETVCGLKENTATNFLAYWLEELNKCFWQMND